jgi:ABC-type transport system involved in multi-copper enzyme maturation permease subunit
MRTIVGSLAWKEFREHWGDLLAAAGVTLVIPAFYAVRDPGSVAATIEVMLMFYPILAGIFLGIRAAVGERARRTAPFLCSLPVRPWLLGLAKLVAASVTVLLPLLLTIALGLVVRRLADQQATLGASEWTTYLTAALASLAVMLAVAVFGAGARSEVLAATRGILALVLLWGGLSLVLSLTDRYLLSQSMRHRMDLPIVTHVALVVAVSLLAIAFVAGYQRAIRPVGEPGQAWVEFRGWIPARPNSPLTALLWKDLRVIAAVSVQVLMISLLLSIVFGALVSSAGHTSFLEVGMESLSVVLWLGGFVLALLIGVGSLGAEVQPAVNTFWRSRPISSSAWYWSKFTLGLAAIAITIGLPTLVTLPFTRVDPTEKGFLWSLLLWIVAFSLSMTLTCLIRQPVRAGILAIGATALLHEGVQACYGGHLFGNPGAPLVALVPAFVAALIASSLTGWWLAVKDYSIAA